MRKISGVVYQQVYLVKPMAADAEALCNLNVEKNYVLTEEQDEIVIPIEYDISVTNMTGYADKKHIKELKAILYINGEKSEEISGSKITSVGNQYMLVITRDKFPPRIEHKIEIKVNGYVHTEFAVDGLMQDNANQSINVFVEPKKVIPVKETDVMLLEKDVHKWVVRPLAQTIETEKVGSIGFVEAGKYLVLRLTLGVDRVENIKIFLGNKLLNSELITETNRKLVLKINVPTETETTLLGQSSLREMEGNYFNVDWNNIGNRKNNPHTLRIVTMYDMNEYETEMLIDTLDTYLSNINTSILINNYDQAMTKIDFEDWINE